MIYFSTLALTIIILRHPVWATHANMELLSVDRFTIKMTISVFAKQVLPESTVNWIFALLRLTIAKTVDGEGSVDKYVKTEDVALTQAFPALFGVFMETVT